MRSHVTIYYSLVNLASLFLYVFPLNLKEKPKKTSPCEFFLFCSPPSGEVVLTSSVAAIFHGMKLKEYYDENDWSDPENPAIDHYSKSKTLAEKAAWDFIENEGHPFEFTVINPALVIGPTLSGDLGESNKAIQMVATGKMPVAVPLQFGYVDVRDVAAAHILAMENPSSNGERFALAEKDLWYKDVSKLLRENGFECEKFSLSQRNY